MEKEFVPYELALRMKQLGFDEPCLAVYRGGSLYGSGTSVNRYYSQGHWQLEKNSNYGGDIKQWVSAPTWQSAFIWFYYSTVYSGFVLTSPNERLFTWCIHNYLEPQLSIKSKERYTTRKEAELSCLEKLIEIVEQSKSE